MPKVREVCRIVRSKAAGPFWVTIDMFFDDPENYKRYANSAALGAGTFARLYGIELAQVKYASVDQLAVVKISYPRPTPQGWITERDMHSGQQYVRLLDIELDPA
jgi:Domain of unknown function (DUF4387)